MDWNLDEIEDAWEGIESTDVCRCGAELPKVQPDETPYQFCSKECFAAEYEENL